MCSCNCLTCLVVFFFGTSTTTTTAATKFSCRGSCCCTSSTTITTSNKPQIKNEDFQVFQYLFHYFENDLGRNSQQDGVKIDFDGLGLVS